MDEGGELLGMFARETDRRVGVILEDCVAVSSAASPSTELAESVRAEAHSLRGAAGVIGQERLAELAEAIERAVAPRTESGGLDAILADDVAAAARALREGAIAAAQDAPEPASVEEGLAALRSR